MTTLPSVTFTFSNDMAQTATNETANIVKRNILTFQFAMSWNNWFGNSQRTVAVRIGYRSIYTHFLRVHFRWHESWRWTFGLATSGRRRVWYMFVWPFYLFRWVFDVFVAVKCTFPVHSRLFGRPIKRHILFSRVLFSLKFQLYLRKWLKRQTNLR